MGLEKAGTSLRNFFSREQESLVLGVRENFLGLGMLILGLGGLN